MKWDAYKELFDGEDEDIVAAAKARYLAKAMHDMDDAKRKAEEDKNKKKPRRFLS